MSDRPGAALAAEVVFPKTIRPDVGTPLTAVLPGDVYYRTGEWQKLTFSQNLQTLLEDVVQGIRGEHKISVDCDCAYIRRILVISEARGGRYSLWLDDLQITGHAAPKYEDLLKTERGAAFNPINLLGCRLALSKTPIFWQDPETDAEVYGVEPFGLDQAKIAAQRAKAYKFTIRQSLAQRSEIGQVGYGEEKPTKIIAAAPSDAEKAEEISPTPAAAVSRVELVSGSGTLADDRKDQLDLTADKKSLVADAIFIRGALIRENKTKLVVRAAQYNGEPLSFLKNLGFNAVYYDAPATPELAKEANAAGIWLIAEPPDVGPIDSQYDSVLTWCYQRGLLRRNYEIEQKKIASIRSRDQIKIHDSSAEREYPRPIIASVADGVDLFTQKNMNLLDGILIDCAPIGTSLDFSDYGAWLLQYNKLIQSDSIGRWCVIQTQYPETTVAQRQQFGIFTDSPGLVSYEQMRQQARLALRAGCG
ncbi:MAG: hypothetical protein HUK22_07550, partial [Thermoguttaceae bacterium]|nr:hypothetical protein [Thermoguttaceae bacterium]